VLLIIVDNHQYL